MPNPNVEKWFVIQKSLTAPGIVNAFDTLESASTYFDEHKTDPNMQTFLCSTNKCSINFSSFNKQISIVDDGGDEGATLNL